MGLQIRGGEILFQRRNERKFEVWKVKFLGYMRIKELKHVLVGTEEITVDENENAYSVLIQFLNERSISLIMRDARKDGRKALRGSLLTRQTANFAGAFSYF